VKVGDLVNFHTAAWMFASAIDDYANPGLIISVTNESVHGNVIAKVLWSDGTYTQEHSSYLRHVNEVYTPDQEINS
jgi:hypothetical protein